MPTFNQLVRKEMCIRDRYYYAQKLNQTAERTEVKHQWRKTGYVLLQMVKDFV